MGWSRDGSWSTCDDYKTLFSLTGANKRTHLCPDLLLSYESFLTVLAVILKAEIKCDQMESFSGSP